MICDGCKPPHTPADCVDTIAGRDYPHRVCACQHKPRQPRATAAPPADPRPAAPGQDQEQDSPPPRPE